MLPLSAADQRLESLLAQVVWFNRLRLVVAASVIWLSALAAHALEVVDDGLPLYVLGGLILVADLLYIVAFRRLRRGRLESVQRHVYLQIAVDLLLLTGLLHYSGGITNPLASFYSFHAVIAALVLSIRSAVVVAVASLVLVSGLAFAERVGLLPHHPLRLGLANLQEITPAGFLLLIFAFASTLALSIYFVATVIARLRRNEGRLVQLSRHLALSEKLASIGTLAAGVSHEINNPIGVITGKVQVLRYRVQDGDSKDRLLGDLDIIDKHAQRIAVITAGLLQFSREEPFELRSVDIPQLLKQAADLVRVPFSAKAVDLVVDNASRVLEAEVLGSANHLLQVLINILLNAKDASAVGGRVELRWAASPTGVELVIRDHGHGIAPQHLGKIFDPFFTTKDVDKGTGLGLAISHGIIERHRGRIEVESELGFGTTFRVVLPCARRTT